jgi:hypothetical protein
MRSDREKVKHARLSKQEATEWQKKFNPSNFSQSGWIRVTYKNNKLCVKSIPLKEIYDATVTESTTKLGLSRSSLR